MNELSATISHAAPQSRSTSPGSPRKALLIAGASRSGTSVLSCLLHALGASVPELLLGPAHGNPTGHWEPKALVTLNEEILAAMGMSWRDPRPIPSAWFYSSPAHDFLCRITHQIQSDFGTSPLIVIKDPRLARLLPLYLKVLFSPSNRW